MLDPYRMVFINIASSFILISFALIYKFLFPKRNINLFFLLVLISILPVIGIFRTGAYESGDFNIHIYRSIEFYRSLSEGILMPSWAGNLNATYGYPLFIFNYTLPYYIISPFHWIGFSFISSLKIFLAVNIVLSGIFMFVFTKKLFRKDLPAFMSSIFYVFAPYHLIDVHFKVAIGEILFFTILPISFLFLNRLVNKPNINKTLLFAISFAGLIASHLIIAIFAGALLLAYAFYQTSKATLKSLSFHLIIAFSISLLATSYVWLGPLMLSRYSYIQNIVLGTAYFPTVQDMLYSPWRFGLLFQGPHGEISHLLGYIQIIVITSLIFLFIKNKLKANRTEIIFWIISFFIIIFLILPYSRFLWESLPLLKVVGSHRLLILTSFMSSVLAGYFAINLKKQWMVYLITVIAILSTILNWGQRRVIPEINDDVLKANLWKSTSEGEAHFYANTIWVDVNNPWFSKPPENTIEIIEGRGTAKKVIRTSTYHNYMVTAETPLKIQENTLYFPGWKGLANGKEVQLSPSNRGIIETSIPKGTYDLDIKYEDLFIYKLLKIIGFSTLPTALMLIAVKSLSNKYFK